MSNSAYTSSLFGARYLRSAGFSLSGSLLTFMESVQSKCSQNNTDTTLELYLILYFYLRQLRNTTSNSEILSQLFIIYSYYEQFISTDSSMALLIDWEFLQILEHRLHLFMDSGNLEQKSILNELLSPNVPVIVCGSEIDTDMEPKLLSLATKFPVTNVSMLRHVATLLTQSPKS